MRGRQFGSSRITTSRRPTMSNAMRPPFTLKPIVGVAFRRQTYRNLLYVLTAFPLGLAYFLFLITGLSIGASLLLVWIGIPVLFLMAAAWWGLGAFERELAMLWLQLDIPPMGRP